MEDDQKQRPESLLPYEQWTETALRQVVAQAIEHVAEHGLPGGHHFYLTFRTDHPGVVIPPRLRAQYPQEMTIVLQHQFWDLKMDREAGADQRRAVVRRRADDAGHPAGCGGRIRRPACPLRPAVPGRAAGGPAGRAATAGPGCRRGRSRSRERRAGDAESRRRWSAWMRSAAAPPKEQPTVQAHSTMASGDPCR